MIYLVGQVPPTLTWLRDKGVTLPRWAQGLSDREEGFTAGEIFLSFLSLLLYVLARLGLVGLTLSSLRALPASAYTAVVWLDSIPHI